MSESKTTNLNRTFVASVLNNLENISVIFNKPATYGFDSDFIEAHTDKKGP